ncbi:MAG: hypothetical protein R3D62_02005 [Xanthobacteraceae bacterium]
MAFEKKTFTPEAIANARRLYEETQAPLDEVAAALGTTRNTLAARIVEWGWAPRPIAKAGLPARTKSTRTARSSKAKRAKSTRIIPRREKRKREKARPESLGPVAASRARRGREAVGDDALAVRVQRVVERELDAIDQILGAIGAADAAEAERSARTLASLARALKEVMRLAAPDEPADADDDDPVPRDLDDFRRELARRLEALAGGGAAQTAGDGGSALP